MDAFAMRVEPAELPGVLVIVPRIHGDARGFFVETWHQQRYEQAGLPPAFVQDNVSSSSRGALRGLHFQHPRAQGKLVYVLRGEIFDVAVDVRVGSPTFGQWCGVTLTGESMRQIYVPEGFAHGFCVTSPTALVAYKCTSAYAPEAERSLIWNDPEVAIRWPVDSPTVSGKDSAAPRLSELRQAGLLPEFAHAVR